MGVSLACRHKPCHLDWLVIDKMVHVDIFISWLSLPTRVLTFSNKECLRVLRPSGSPMTACRFAQPLNPDSVQPSWPPISPDIDKVHKMQCPCFWTRHNVLFFKKNNVVLEQWRFPLLIKRQCHVSEQEQCLVFEQDSMCCFGTRTTSCFWTRTMFCFFWARAISCVLDKKKVLLLNKNNVLLLLLLRKNSVLV